MFPSVQAEGLLAEILFYEVPVDFVLWEEAGGDPEWESEKILKWNVRSVFPSKRNSMSDEYCPECRQLIDPDGFCGCDPEDPYDQYINLEIQGINWKGGGDQK